MQYEDLPIDVFIGRCFRKASVINLISDWRLEIEDIQKIVIGYFKDIGVFNVRAFSQQAEFLEAKVEEVIQRSPEIVRLRHEAERRHADMRSKMMRKHGDF